ncbi:hypothetical protein L218DRAFT_1082502, partial [Marasmius fiardii PR-910]
MSTPTAPQRGDYRQLSDSEEFWLACEPWLKERGYLLRPRYRPGWVPSWSAEKDVEWMIAEDGQVRNTVKFMDAERVSDGAIVYFKRLYSTTRRKNADELEMIRLLAPEPFASDPRNHCIPCYSILNVPETIAKDNVLLELPFLNDFFTPEFETVGEVVEFFRQTLEGLHFLHSYHIAHNDIKWDNILMDHSPLYDVPPHPIAPAKARDWSRDVKTSTRTD